MHLGRHLGAVKLKLVSTLLLGPIHGGVGVPEQTVEILVVEGIDRHSDAGADADLVLVDPDAAWTLRVADFHTKGRTTAQVFEGREVVGVTPMPLPSGVVSHRPSGPAA